MKINQSKVNIFLIVLSVSSFQPVMGIPCFLPSFQDRLSLSLLDVKSTSSRNDNDSLRPDCSYIGRRTFSLLFGSARRHLARRQRNVSPPHAIDFRAAPTHTRQLFQTRFRLDDAGFLRFLAIPEGDKTNGNSSALFLPAAFTLNSVWLKRRRRRKRRNNPTREGLAMTCIMSRLHPPVTFQ